MMHSMPLVAWGTSMGRQGARGQPQGEFHLANEYLQQPMSGAAPDCVYWI